VLHLYESSSHRFIPLFLSPYPSPSPSPSSPLCIAIYLSIDRSTVLVFVWCCSLVYLAGFCPYSCGSAPPPPFIFKSLYPLGHFSSPPISERRDSLILSCRRNTCPALAVPVQTSTVSHRRAPPPTAAHHHDTSLLQAVSLYLFLSLPCISTVLLVWLSLCDSLYLS